MTALISRRNFLRGRFSPRTVTLRPPWAIAEAAFLRACTRCGDCRTACPTTIIVSAGDGSGYPTIDFRVGECTFCAACVSACASGALQRVDEEPVWRVRASIAGPCLAQQQVECRICGDQCLAGAIAFPPRVGGVAVPVVDTSRCTGCGACVAPCPTRAIRVA